MADKMRPTFPIPIIFGEGETPSALKLNSIATQARNGLRLIEVALGDIWNQSGDVYLSDFPAQITNLARTLGGQADLNGQLVKPDLENAETIIVSESTFSQIGQTLLHLNFTPVEGTGELLNTFIQTSVSPVPTRKNGLNNFTGLEDYFVDTARGVVYLSDPWVASYINYEVAGENFPSDSNSINAFNVIPHPLMEAGWKGLKFVRVSQNKYQVYLPPRRPLSNSLSEKGKIPRLTEGEGNQVVPDVTPEHKYWYSNISDWNSASSAEQEAISNLKRYRHTLPNFLYELITDGSPGTLFSTGTIYLWDNQQKTIVEGITFKVAETNQAYGGGPWPWVFQIEGSILDSLIEDGNFDSLVSTDNPDDYKERFSIITVGESIASKLKGLTDKLIENNIKTGAANKISHEDLKHLQPRPRDLVFDAGQFRMPPSLRRGDDHSYLLSREGSTTNSLSQRDRFNNGILGDLLILSSNKVTTNAQNISAASQKIFFGSLTQGTNIGFVPNTSNIGSGAELHSLRLQGGSLELSVPRIIFTSTSGVRFTNNCWNFYHGADSRIRDASIATGSIYIVASAVTGITNAADAFARMLINGSTTDSNSAQNNEVGAYSFVAAGSLARNLYFSATTNHRIILNNDVQLNSNRLRFGPIAENSYIERGGNSYYFYESGNFLNSKIFGGNYIAMNSLGYSFSNESTRIINTNPANSTGNFEFYQAGSIANSKLIAGSLNTTTNGLYFGAIGSNNRITYSGVTFSFAASNSINSSVVRAGNIETGIAYVGRIDVTDPLNIISSEGAFRTGVPLALSHLNPTNGYNALGAYSSNSGGYPPEYSFTGSPTPRGGLTVGVENGLSTSTWHNLCGFLLPYVARNYTITSIRIGFFNNLQVSASIRPVIAATDTSGNPYADTATFTTGFGSINHGTGIIRSFSGTKTIDVTTSASGTPPWWVTIQVNLAGGMGLPRPIEIQFIEIIGTINRLI